MKKNMGTIDRIVRLLLAAAVGVLILTGELTGVAAIVLGILAGVFLFTGATSSCLLYLPFGISTMKKR